MALADPAVISLGGVNTNFSRVNVFSNKSVYQTDDGLVKFTVSHTPVGGGKTGQEARTRHLVRIDRSAVVANPVTLANEEKSSSVYLVIDQPLVGFSDAQLIADFTSLTGFLSASSNAKLAQVLTDQS